jgi:hypothetical protein
MSDRQGRIGANMGSTAVHSGSTHTYVDKAALDFFQGLNLHLERLRNVMRVGDGHERAQHNVNLRPRNKNLRLPWIHESGAGRYKNNKA